MVSSRARIKSSATLPPRASMTEKPCLWSEVALCMRSSSSATKIVASADRILAALAYQIARGVVPLGSP